MKKRTVEENTQRYLQLMETIDVLLIPMDKFYWDCRGEEEHAGELVIWELEKKGFEVKTVQVRGFLIINDYIQISKVF